MNPDYEARRTIVMADSVQPEKTIKELVVTYLKAQKLRDELQRKAKQAQLDVEDLSKELRMRALKIVNTSLIRIGNVTYAFSKPVNQAGFSLELAKFEE